MAALLSFDSRYYMEKYAYIGYFSCVKLRKIRKDDGMASQDIFEYSLPMPMHAAKSNFDAYM